MARSMRVVEAIERYNISLVYVDQYPSLRHGKKASIGPRGFALDIERRSIYVKCSGLTTDHLLQTAALWHEACHIICQPPRFDIEQVAEHTMLLQFERAVAAACFYRHDLCDVIEYQLGTAIDEYDLQGVWLQELRDAGKLFAAQTRKAYMTTKIGWNRGFQLAQKLGLLDGKLQPTFETADWSKLTRQDWLCFSTAL